MIMIDGRYNTVDGIDGIEIFNGTMKSSQVDFDFTLNEAHYT